MFTSNLILATDSYKTSHYSMMNPEVTHVYSYIESRGGNFDSTLFFGLQAFLKTYLSKPVTLEDIDEAEEFITSHGLPFNRTGWEIIVKEYNGYLPLKISALKEGTIVPVKNALVVIENTDPRLGWLTGYIETALLRAIWYPTTVATLSWNIKQDIRKALEKSSDNVEEALAFRLHDFGARGVSSSESAALGGMAHLINFMGSDTMEGIYAARKFYGEKMAGFSIPASEHMVMTSFGKNEEKAFDHILDVFAKSGKMVAIVSDTYDLFNAVKNILGKKLKSKIMESNAVVVCRPDSGNPLEIPIQTIKLLAEEFGYTINSKGYKVLHPSIRVIQGDGINQKSIQGILENLLAEGFSAENLAFGMGGQLLGAPMRDDQKFAMKASAIKIDGEWIGISKDPKTDPGKKSKEGRLSVISENGVLKTVKLEGHEEENLLKVAYENGQIIDPITFAEVRANSNNVIMR